MKEPPFYRRGPRFVDPKRDGPTSEADLELRAEVDTERPLNMGPAKKIFVALFYGLGSTVLGTVLYHFFWYLMTEDDRYRIGDLVDESWAFFFGTVPGVLSLVLVSALACALFALLVFGRLHFDIIAVMGTSGAVLAGLLHAGTYLTFFLISLARADPLVPWSRIWDGLLLAFGSGFSCGVIATVVLAVLFRNAWRKRTYRLTPVEDAAAAPAADRTEAVPATPSTRPAVPPVQIVVARPALWPSDRAAPASLPGALLRPGDQLGHRVCVARLLGSPAAPTGPAAEPPPQYRVGVTDLLAAGLRLAQAEHQRRPVDGRHPAGRIPARRHVPEQ